MKVTVIPALCLLVGLYLCATARASSHDELMVAATAWEGSLPCEKWNCDCLFNKSTGCCCVTNELYHTEEHIFLSLVELWQDVEKLNDEIDTLLGGRKVSFTAYMKPQVFPERCFGPFTRNVPIPFSNITLNQGNAYNSALGTFTVQVPGIYFFSFSIYSNVESAGMRLYTLAQLVLNGEPLLSVWEDNREDSEDSATQTVTLQLNQGDQVYVELVLGRYLCADFNQRNVFSGYMVYPLQ